MSNIINEFAINCDDLLCPDGDLGAMGLQSEDCSDVDLSEINSLILRHPTKGSNINNWGPSLALADLNIDNSDATDVAQKRIYIIGSKPEPEETTVTVNSLQDVTLNKTFTLTAELFTYDDVTRDYLRKLECNKIKPRFWYTTMGGYIHGRDGGIIPSKFTLSEVLESGEESVYKFVFNIQWKALTSDDRFVNPLP